MIDQNIVRLAQNLLPEPSTFAKTNRSGTTWVTLSNRDHSIPEYDKVDVYFKTSIDENADFHWDFVTMKVRSMSPGYDAKDYNVTTLARPLRLPSLKISPKAKEAIDRYKLNPEEIKGSGHQNKILYQDVEDYIKEELIAVETAEPRPLTKKNK